MISLASPWFLLLLLPIALWAWRAFTPRRGAAIRYSSLGRIRSAAQNQSTWRMKILPMLRLATLVLLVIAIARPRSGERTTEILSEGVDIVITLDTSGSMKAIDASAGGNTETNRLKAAVEVAKTFIRGRTADRIGLVVFGEEAFTQCPLTLDYGVLLSFLDRTEIGMAGEGTALGSAIGVATNRIKEVPGKSRIIILVTDGRNTAGRIPPIEAARAAAAYGVKIYTIGIGSNQAYLPVSTILGRQLVAQQLDLDEDTLKAIADETGGRYFRATDAEALKRTYDIINELERTEVEIKEHMEYTELFGWFLIPALALLLLEIALANTRLLKLP